MINPSTFQNPWTFTTAAQVPTFAPFGDGGIPALPNPGFSAMPTQYDPYSVPFSLPYAMPSYGIPYNPAFSAMQLPPGMGGVYGGSPYAPGYAPTPGWSYNPKNPMRGMPLISPAFTAGVKTNAQEIKNALALLAITKNLPQDEEELKKMGVNVTFHSGQEAVDLIRRRGIKVIFEDIEADAAHAEWVKDRNAILINENYRGNNNLPTLLALAEAIYHEAGHASTDGDSLSSIQEEVDCLALNAMAWRSHAAMFPWYGKYKGEGPRKALFENGVALYPKLFFDKDPYKKELVNRVIEKYGILPPDSPGHPIPHLSHIPSVVERIIREIQRRQARQYFEQNSLSNFRKR